MTSDRRLGLERIEIIKICDVPQDQHRNAHARGGRAAGSAIQRERIFRGDCARSGKYGTRPTKTTGRGGDRLHCPPRTGRVAAAFVDDDL